MPSITRLSFPAVLFPKGAAVSPGFNEALEGKCPDVFSFLQL